MSFEVDCRYQRNFDLIIINFLFCCFHTENHIQSDYNDDQCEKQIANEITVEQMQKKQH